MILDAQALFSGTATGANGALVGQGPITATAVSTNTIDLSNMGALTGGRNIGVGMDVKFYVKSVQAFNNLTSLTVDLISTTDAALSAGIVVEQSYSRTLAQLTADTVQVTGTLPSIAAGRLRS